MLMADLRTLRALHSGVMLSILPLQGLPELPFGLLACGCVLLAIFSF